MRVGTPAQGADHHRPVAAVKGALGDDAERDGSAVTRLWIDRGMTDYDDIVIGTGMGGLTVGAMLSRAGRRVLMLEAHDVPGGYAHTFRIRDFRFCAQVHYIFNCGEGESIHNLLT